VRTEDFLEVAEQVAGRDLDTVWDAWLYGTTAPATITRLPESAG
jgi:aminopeptidase N